MPRFTMSCMTMELPPENTVFHLEEQYEVAAWESTIRSLSLLWTDPVFHIEAKHLSTPIRDLAQAAFKDPSDILHVAKQTPRNKYPADLLDVGVLVRDGAPRVHTGSPIAPSGMLTLALKMYYGNDTILQQIADQSMLWRFENDIELLVTYNQPRLHGAITQSGSLVNTLRTVQHDNSFYIGKWDNDRSLNRTKNDV